MLGPAPPYKRAYQMAHPQAGGGGNWEATPLRCPCFKKDILIDVCGWGYASGRDHNKPRPFYSGTNEGACPKEGRRGHVV